MKKENVLVIPANQIQFDGLIKMRSDWALQSIKTMERVAVLTQRTDALERDEDWLQVCTYCVMMRDGKLLAYRRGKTGAEDRLHDLWSVGVGGHCNSKCIAAEQYRELCEELGSRCANRSASSDTVWFLRDNSNAVGRVHLGIVTFHGFEFGRIDPEHSLCDAQMVTLEGAAALNLESWSRIVVDEMVKERGEK